MTEKKEKPAIEDIFKNTALSIGIQFNEIKKASFLMDKAVGKLILDANHVQAEFSILREQNLWMKDFLKFVIEKSSDEEIRSKAEKVLRNCECQV